MVKIYTLPKQIPGYAPAQFVGLDAATRNNILCIPFPDKITLNFLAMGGDKSPPPKIPLLLKMTSRLRVNPPFP